MNPKSARAPSQSHLQFEQDDIWQQMPAAERGVCAELLTQILIDIMKAERSDQDERQD